jgi:uncharacterized membrane protein YbhN (UPF0104 family)
VDAESPSLIPRRRTTFYARIAFAVVVLAALVIAGRRYYGELGRLKSVDPSIVALMAGLYVLGRLPPAAILRSALVALGHRIDRAETFFVLMVQYYVNMLIPRSGIAALAGYLKVRRNVPVADVSASQLVLLILAQFVVLGISALACQGALAARGVAKFDPLLAIVFAGISVISITALLMPIPSGEPAQEHHGLLRRFTSRLSGASRRLSRDPRVLARAFAAHGVVLLIRAARIQLSFRAVDAHVGYWQAFVASCAADVMFLISITPGALGFREGGLIYAAKVLGTTGDVALAAAVLDRIVLTGCNIVLGQIGLWQYVGASSTNPLSQTEPGR